MPLSLRRFALLTWLLPQLCVASTLPIDPRGETLYQQALPYLVEANSKLEAVTAETPTTGAEEKERSLILAGEAGLLIKEATPPLEKAATLGHPVAQYRLGLIYVQLYPSEVIKEKACPLFEQSLAQGFAPAALEISSWCLAFTDTPQYQAALHSLESSMPLFEQYFPQPTVRLQCRREEPVGFAMQWGDGPDYQAEIYRLLGDSNRAQRLEYYQKAVDLNDCYRAKRRLEIFKQP